MSCTSLVLIINAWLYGIGVIYDKTSIESGNINPPSNWKRLDSMVVLLFWVVNWNRWVLLSEGGRTMHNERMEGTKLCLDLTSPIWYSLTKMVAIDNWDFRIDFLQWRQQTTKLRLDLILPWLTRRSWFWFNNLTPSNSSTFYTQLKLVRFHYLKPNTNRSIS